MYSNNFLIHSNITNEPSSYEEWEDILLKGKTPELPLYATEGNLTTAELERVLAKFQGHESCLVTTSGRSAIGQALMAILKSGDHVLVSREAYRSTRFFCENKLSQFGIEVSLYDLCDIDSLHEQIKPEKTKIIMLEVPSNPMTRVPDFEPFFELKEEFGIQLLLDASLAGYENFKDYQFDLIFHSVSKFGTGVGDVMAGAIIGGKEIIKQIRNATRSCCDILDPNVASVILKGLKTYPFRFLKQVDTSLRVAKELERSKYFDKVYYPGLESHPDYVFAKKQMQYFGQIISIQLKINEENFKSFFDNLKIFRLSYGAGFTHSLIAPTKLFYLRGLSSQPKKESSASNTTVRLSIGLEDPEMLIEDLYQAIDNISSY